MDYQCKNDEFRDYVRWLRTGFGDVEIPALGGTIVNIGSIIEILNLQFEFSIVPSEVPNPWTTFGWVDAIIDEEKVTEGSMLLAMQTKIIHLNIGSRNEGMSRRLLKIG